jgi:hypothetical protein
LIVLAHPTAGFDEFFLEKQFIEAHLLQHLLAELHHLPSLLHHVSAVIRGALVTLSAVTPGESRHECNPFGYG